MPKKKIRSPFNDGHIVLVHPPALAAKRAGGPVHGCITGAGTSCSLVDVEGEGESVITNRVLELLPEWGGKPEDGCPAPGVQAQILFLGRLDTDGVWRYHTSYPNREGEC